jgi:hypothetical protein
MKINHTSQHQTAKYYKIKKEKKNNKKIITIIMTKTTRKG